MFPHTPDNIQVSQSRLDHHDISTFGNVQVYFTQSLAYVSRVHLVRATVTKLRGGTRRFTEWSIEARSVLGRVRHDGRRTKTTFVQRMPDCADTAIHHVRWRYYIGPSFYM